MSFTTPLDVVKFTSATYADVRSESLGTGDGVETNFYVQNKMIWGSGSVTAFVNNAAQNSSTYTVDEQLGKLQFTAAVGNGSTVIAHYTYASVSSAVMQNFINFADNYIISQTNDTTDSTKMQLLSNFMAAHLFMKNLAALRARDGTINYSIGYINVAKGDKETEMANVYWNNFTQAINRTIIQNHAKVSWPHPGNDFQTTGYYDRKLVRDM